MPVIPRKIPKLASQMKQFVDDQNPGTYTLETPLGGVGLVGTGLDGTAIKTVQDFNENPTNGTRVGSTGETSIVDIQWLPHVNLQNIDRT